MSLSASLVYWLFIGAVCVRGITSPYGWKHRRSLNGLWKFKLSPVDDQGAGFREQWWKKPLTGELYDMPVPGSYNDITTDRTVRDYLGWVWYQTPEPVDVGEWSNFRTVIHFGGVHYYAIVWFGDEIIGMHEGGHLPFEFELPEGVTGFITVAVNNTLTSNTIPQGFVQHHPSENKFPAYQTYHHDFDYFDYAGIDRNVFLYATSKQVYITNVAIKTDYKPENIGVVEFNVTTSNTSSSDLCMVTLYDENQGNKTLSSCSGTFEIPNPTLWWNAFSQHGSPGHLYSLSVELQSPAFSNGESIYKTKVGIRSISWNNDTLFLNGKPIYLKGFGKHEDSDIHGRGFDWSITMRDFELLGWTKANVIRTTHYPPSIELVEMADKKGILLIVESPACSLSNFNDVLLERHTDILNEMFMAYGSHPSVLMWSLANEPVTSDPNSDIYFSELVNTMRSLDDTRPITFVTSQQPSNDKAVKHVDVICVNRYNGWYSFSGELERITDAVEQEVMTWRNMYHVPLFFTEYGAESLSGLHNLPSSMWSEDYQTDLLKTHFQVFDLLKSRGDLAGELMWVFADFATPQEYIRAGGCLKGIFTRNRQPKKAAYTIRERYGNLSSTT